MDGEVGEEGKSGEKRLEDACTMRYVALIDDREFAKDRFASCHFLCHLV